MTEDRWATPQQLNDLTLAFPANAMEFMPTREEAKQGLEALEPEKRRTWLRFAHRWFAQGLPATAQFHLEQGVDGETAIRHLNAILGSFAPKHEHKEEAVAYLASRWFARVEGL